MSETFVVPSGFEQLEHTREERKDSTICTETVEARCAEPCCFEESIDAPRVLGKVECCDFVASALGKRGGDAWSWWSAACCVEVFDGKWSFAGYLGD